MQVIKAPHTGFCYGVKRAVDLAVREGKKNFQRVYSIGPLIHNRQMVEMLRQEGVIPEEDVNLIEKGVVVFRTHGIKKEEETLLRKKGLNIIDATCPFVKKVREYAMILKKEGYKVVIVGDRNHPEIKSVLSYLDNDGIVLNRYQKVRGKKIGIVSQTTEDMRKFLDVVKRIIEDGIEIKVYNTICRIPRIREKEAVELAKKVDVMLVVGGKISSNTKKLFGITKEVNPNAYQIETEKDIDVSWLNGAKSVGITGGTSTPEIIIDNVVKFLKSL